MQVFNEINSRKLGDKEYNVFAGFFNNSLFISILIFTIVVQLILVEVGGQACRCAPQTWQYNLAAIGIGFGSLIFGLLAKIAIPSSIFNRIGIKQHVMSDQEE